MIETHKKKGIIKIFKDFIFDVDFEKNEEITIQKLTDEFMKYNELSCDLLDWYTVNELAEYKEFMISVPDDDDDILIEFVVSFEIIKLLKESIYDYITNERDSIVKFKDIQLYKE